MVNDETPLEAPDSDLELREVEEAPWYSQTYLNLLEAHFEPDTVMKLLNYPLVLPPQYYGDSHTRLLPLKILVELLNNHLPYQLGTLYTDKLRKLVSIIVDTTPDNDKLTKYILEETLSHL